MGSVNKVIAKLKDLLRMKVFQALLFAVLGVISYFIMFSNVTTEKVDVSLLTPADKTIRATQTVIDKEMTEAARQEAAGSVEDVFTLKKEYAENRVDLIASIFESIQEVKDAQEKKTKGSKEGEEPPEKFKAVLPAHLSMVKDKLTGDVTRELSDSTFTALLKAGRYDTDMAKDLTLTAVNSVMGTRIPAEEVGYAKNRAEEQIKISSLPRDVKDAAIELARFAIIQNEFYDKQKSEEKLQAALEGVEPVRILQGEVIVEKGQLVDRDIYRQLKIAGFLENDKSYRPFIGLGLFILIAMGGLYYYFQAIKDPADNKQSDILLFGIVYLLSLIVMKTVSLFQESEYIDMVYFFPAAFAAMLIKILLNERLAIAMTIVLSSFGTIVFNEGIASNLHLAAGLYILLSGAAGIILLNTKDYRSKILQAGLLLSLLNMLLVCSLLLIMDARTLRTDFVFYIISSTVSGLASSILTIGVLPFFEMGFGILTSMKLIELSNPNHPLLRKILTDAPGTYHHSVMVANLAESASEAIGANGLLARVGCYYHDIGKTERPQFFIENQMNIENPHDRLDPDTSKEIIVSHVTDGVDSLKKHRLPEEIIAIAREHHGTTMLKYFYHKAKQEGRDIREKDYRYPGPKPQSKEAAVISIADSVEAAVRSMKQPTAEAIDGLIKNIIVDRLQDGQFNECDITMKELDIVNKSLGETLKGIFHNRIEYPDLKK
ncbi:HD family phosphohydrolase [Peribacillus sp. SCS-37]|uniref:HD family phosphohydrolase n=1 Tax=Paraperibacillus esterisolvens TaxID=3115296 RepID=UPI003906CFF1